MNLKLKTLAVAVAMTVAGGVQAAPISSDNGGGIPGSGTGDGDLFLSVIDRVNQRSFVLNTNLTANQFRANPNVAYSFTHSALNQFLTDAGPGVSQPDAVRWNIGVISNDRDSDNDGTPQDADVANYGILTTSSPGQAVTPTNSPPGNFGLEGAVGNAHQYLAAVNQWDGNNDSTFDTTVQDYVIVTDSTSVAYHDGGFWAGTWGGATGFTTEGAIGESLDFWFIHTDPNEPFFTSLVDEFAGNWKLDFAGGIGTLSYTVAAVPVPAAVWLMGSGLLGLVAVARRRAGSTGVGAHAA